MVIMQQVFSFVKQRLKLVKTVKLKPLDRSQQLITSYITTNGREVSGVTSVGDIPFPLICDVHARVSFINIHVHTTLEKVNIQIGLQQFLLHHISHKLQ
jgi:hypothetical protein